MPREKKTKTNNSNQYLLQERLNQDPIVQEQIALLNELPDELLELIIENLTAKEIAALSAVSDRFRKICQEYFRKCNEKLINDNFWDSNEGSLLLNETNPQALFNNILGKIFNNLSVKSKLQLKPAHAYLIFLIKYDSTKALRDFVENNFKNKSINFELIIPKNKNPFQIAIDHHSLEKLEILMHLPNTASTKILPLIHYAIEKNDLEIVRFLWDEFNNSNRLLSHSNKEIELFHLATERSQFLQEFIFKSVGEKHFDILLYFLYLTEDLTLLIPEATLLEMTKLALAHKHLETVNFLLEKIPNLKCDFNNISMILTAAIIYDFPVIALDFIKLLDNNSCRTHREFSDFMDLIIEAIYLNKFNTEIIPFILEKFSKAVTDEHLAKIFEVIVEKEEWSSINIFMQQSFFTERMARICLCIALMKNNFALFNFLYTNPANQCNASYKGKSLLVYAIQANFEVIVDEIAKRVKLTSNTPSNDPLLIAIEGDQLAIVKILLAHNAVVTMEYLDAAIAAKKSDVLQLLINNWSDENPINFSQLLYSAVQENDLACVKILVSAGADPDTVITEEQSSQLIWDIAAEASQWEIVHYLLSQSELLTNPDKRNELEELSAQDVADILYNILIEAAVAKQDELVLLLLPYVPNLIDQEGNSLLHHIVKGECLKSTKYLCKENLSFPINQAGYTPVDIAVMEGCKAVVEYFIARGWKVNSEDKFRNSPLFNALINGQLQIAELLIEKGAHVDNNLAIALPKNNAKNELQTFSNYYLAIKSLDHIDMLNLLIEKEPTLSHFLKDKTPPPQLQLLYIAQIGDLETFFNLRTLYAIDINFATPKGETFLTKAIKFGQFKFIQELIAHGASVNGVNPSRPVVIATKHQQWEILYYLIEKANALSNYTEEQLQELSNLVLGSLDEDLASNDISAEKSIVFQEKCQQQNKILEAIDHLLKQQTKEKQPSIGFWSVTDEDDPLRRTRNVAPPNKKTKETSDNNRHRP